MRRLIPFLCAFALPTLAACGEPNDEAASAQDEAVRGSELDLKAYSFVSVAVAYGDKAIPLEQALRAAGAREIDDGEAVLAGITQRELEGGEHDPSAEPTESAFGLMCGKDGVGNMSCSVAAVARTSDIETKKVDAQGTEVTLVSKVTLRGLLARKVLPSLPQTSPAGLIGSMKTGYAPLGIECESTSGHDQNGQVASCALPATGFGASFTFADAVAEGQMKKAEAIDYIRYFFPKG